ncbi:MAG TPA: NAD(P)H-dependent oxidoreductase [Rhizomicrobium sp.]|nr:NAD(P)H-dependent oxidoreductase [Rhizomicrobium sp.]
MAPRLHTVIASTRPGRIGPLIAHWFNDFAKAHGKFDAHLVDLADFNLPLIDEPHHPMRRQYQHEHTKKWAASVAAADAFVFVTPEYNYGPPPSLLNAFDYLYLEWNYTPASFVSYGGVSAGMRSSGRGAQTAATLKMMPIPESVGIPNVFTQLADGAFKANDLNTAGATSVLNELAKWEEALRGIRSRHREGLLKAG